MEKIAYPAIFHPEEVGYSVTVPDLEGCFTEGDTLDEAIEMTRDVIGLCLEDYPNAYPQPSKIEDILLEPGDFVRSIPFDVIQYRRENDTRAVQKTLSIPSWLNMLAEENNINLSGLLQSALMERLHIKKA